MTTEDKDFLARWSRRKQAAREGLVEPEPESPAVPAETADGSPTASEPIEPVNEDAFADVDFDALDYSSDYTRFMGKDVPELIQRKALRALWRSDPVLANVDGLNDYDEDFTDAARAVANLVTSYKPRRGYRTDEEMAAIEAEEKAEAEAAQDEDLPEDPESVGEQLEQVADAPSDPASPASSPDDGSATQT